jgi:glycosyltransferase involved in cell wall biosynthesis
MRAEAVSGSAGRDAEVAGDALRIVFLLPALVPAGMETMGLGLAAALRARGHVTTFVCTDEPGPLAEAAVLAGSAVVAERPRPRGALNWSRALARIISSFAPHVVHIHNAPWLRGAVAARRASTPVVVHTLHGFDADDGWRLRLQLRAGARLSDAVVGVSPALVEYMRGALRLPARKIRLVRNGIDAARFTGAATGRLRRLLSVSPESLLVGIVARLHPVKDHVTLIHAFEKARMAVPHAHLVLFGDGPERSTIEALLMQLGLEQCVHLCGVRLDLPELLPELDVAVLSSRAEGLPMSLLETMAAGCCTVATAVGAIPELVAPDSGVCVPAGDADALAAALELVLGDAGLRSAMGRAARQRVTTQYSLEAMAGAYEQIYRQRLRESTRRA